MEGLWNSGEHSRNISQILGNLAGRAVLFTTKHSSLEVNHGDPLALLSLTVKQNDVILITGTAYSGDGRLWHSRMRSWSGFGGVPRLQGGQRLYLLLLVT